MATKNIRDLTGTSNPLDLLTKAGGDSLYVRNGFVAENLQAGSVGIDKIAPIASTTVLGNLSGGNSSPVAISLAALATALPAFSSTTKGLVPASGGGTLNFLRADGTWAAPPAGGSLADGNRGDITVSGAGTAWTINANAVTLSDLQQIGTQTFLGRTTASTGNVEVLTTGQATALLDTATTSLKGLMAPADKTKLDGVALGATANATDAQLRDRATHTGSQAISTITGLQAALDGKEGTIALGTTSQYRRGDKTWQTLDKAAVGLSNVDNTSDLSKPVSTATQTALNARALNGLITGSGLTMATARILGRTTAATGAIEEITATQATALLDTFTTTAKGLVPAPGTSNTTDFLRRDGTWAAPAGGGGSLTDGNKGDITVSASGATWTINPNAVILADLQQVGTGTFLGRTTAATGNVESLTATQATALLNNATTSLKGLMSNTDKTKLDGIATGATANSTDATLRDRATHTGTQAISTVSGLQTALDAKANTTTPTLTGGTVGTTAGNQVLPVALTATTGGNSVQTFLAVNRASAGTDWTTTRSRLTTRVDVTDITYIDLKTDTASPGIAFGTGAAGTVVERMRIDQSGNVGIGTASPGARLDVNGSGNFNGGLFTSTGNGIFFNGNGVFSSGVAGNGNALALFSGNTERVRITDTGAVGIGTTGPQSTFQIVGAARVGAAPASTNAQVAIYNDGTSGVIEAFSGANSATKYGLCLNAYGGSVGIGTNNPQDRLHVAGGDVRIDNTRSLRFTNTAGTATTAFTMQSDNNFVAYNAAGVPIWNFTSNSTPSAAFGANGANRMSYDSSGGGSVSFLVGGGTHFSINAGGGITSANNADAVGYKGLPQNSQTSAYTLALADQGRHISITTGGVTIPSNASVAFPIGTTIVIYNNSAAAQNVSITTDTLRLAGTATTGTRSVAQRGLCTLVKVLATEWVATGNIT